MTAKLKNTIEEKLQKATSQMAVDIVISHNATQEDINSGVYQPINKMSTILNFDLVPAQQVVKQTNTSLIRKK